MKKRVRSAPPPLPSREDVQAFIRRSRYPVSRKDLEDAFGITGRQKTPFRAMLKEMAHEGAVDESVSRKHASIPSLQSIASIRVLGPDDDGDLMAEPAEWPFDDVPKPVIVLESGRPAHAALEAGEVVLAKLRKLEPGVYSGKLLAKKEEQTEDVLLVVRTPGHLLRLEAVSRKDYRSFYLDQPSHQLEEDDLLLCQTMPQPFRRGRVKGLRPGEKPRGDCVVRLLKHLGKASNPANFSMMSVFQHDLPHLFSAEALALAEARNVPDDAGRADLRGIPLVTIDGEDARDFDDAVFAEPDPDAANKDGWHLIVAIADVSYYVRPYDALDREAMKRGNSVYFVDRVVPMLPENLSNNLCSLRPDENRACVAVHLWVDKDGNLLRYRFVRGLMRSVARLTYNQVQSVLDQDKQAPHLKLDPQVTGTLIPNLQGAYESLMIARRKRHTLELDIPEFKVRLNPQGEVASISRREKLSSHQIIETFMIAANVAAAEFLQKSREPAIYRVHQQPDELKMQDLGTILSELGFSIPQRQGGIASHLNDILTQAKDQPESPYVSTAILRSQMQAYYSPENLGHFGLGLTHYCHFTSPIRRYSDLIVHRALLRAIKAGEKDEYLPEDTRLEPVAEHISFTERKAMLAERDTLERYVSHYLRHHVGKTFHGYISGTTHVGLFVTLDDTGASGLVPIRTLGNDFYNLNASKTALIGRRTGETFHIGQPLTVKLVICDPATGSLTFELAHTGDRPARRSKRDFADFGDGGGNGGGGKRPHRKGKGHKPAARKHGGETRPEGPRAEPQRPGGPGKPKKGRRKTWR